MGRPSTLVENEVVVVIEVQFVAEGLLALLLCRGYETERLDFRAGNRQHLVRVELDFLLSGWAVQSHFQVLTRLFLAFTDFLDFGSPPVSAGLFVVDLIADLQTHSPIEVIGGKGAQWC